MSEAAAEAAGGERLGAPERRSGLVAAARANLGPGLALTAFAIAVLLGYELWPPMRAALQRLAGWRAEQPLPVALGFAALTTTLAGAVLPAAVQRLRPSAPSESPGAFLYLLLFWAVVGLQVDLLYRGLDGLLGDGRGPAIVAGKVFLDMFVYCPLWAMPETVAVYGFKDAGFSWSRFRRRHAGRGWYRREVFPLLCSCWAVWIPAVCVIYLLPLPLQLPMQNIVLAFWCLMLGLLAAPEPEDAA
ncbi:hypothetical protein [Phycisphaera mikurensis]|uniref:Uncharacterized protein n=1 Tax=Phycisphaera mikurensis (strain NBRC 102666 / KCTC 22515 / FYK2301M01) TaxID=1142394 RepID=I0ID48_PHYMF|nr:hypothetical protein [Phycisphaera mikurensis]MBB6442310.1 hypothetical protein [Phycisphaera mikurensis]BAM03186.1 hypothetical protein PSMK_10270 [Phycisphaera mikurensis NBRC 102666]